jgi:hypothetical protein
MNHTLKNTSFCSLLCLFVTNLLLASLPAFAQQAQMPLDQVYNYRLERHLNKPGVGFHTAMKPYLESEVLPFIPSYESNLMGIPAYSNYLNAIEDTGSVVAILPYKPGIGFNFRRGDLIQFQKEKVYIGINPLVDAVGGYDLREKSTLFSAQYGAHLTAHFGRKVSAGFSYRGIAEQPMDYIARIAEDREVLPGFSKATFDGELIRSKDFNGYVSFTPVKYFNMQAGYGRHFWGDGYRSMFLSDHAPSYPYLLMNANIWRIKYSYLFNVMQSANPTDIAGKFDFQTKYGVFHMLSVDVARWFQFSFFEGVVWEAADSTGRRGIEVNYLNPVVFLRPVEFAVGSPDNITLGVNLKFKADDKAVFYTQLLLDDLDIKKARAGRGFYRNKFAWQAGIKTYNMLNIPMLDFQAEMNLVRPYVYAHKTPEQNYTHMNMPLAHPLGANFMELLAILRYEKKGWYGLAKLQYARQGRDDIGQHNGSNIYVSDFLISPNLDVAYNNKFLQGVSTRIVNAELRGGYLLNPRTNLSIEAILNYRKLSSELENQDNLFFGGGLRCNIFNRYRDF